MLRRFLRTFFHHLYHTLSWTYDLVAAFVSWGQWQRWGLGALNYVHGPRVLELGFGPGHLQATLHEHGLQTCGLDESRQMAARAARRLKKRGLPQQLVRGLAQALPYPADCFDTVLATFPTEYIFDPRSLSEVLRVLKPGGRLVVLPMAWIGGGNPAGQLLRVLFRVTGQAQPVTDELLKTIRAPYEQAGFAVEAETVTSRGSTLVFVLARKPGPL